MFQQKAGFTPGRPRVTAASGLHGGPSWSRLQRGELSKLQNLDVKNFIKQILHKSTELQAKVLFVRISF